MKTSLILTLMFLLNCCGAVVADQQSTMCDKAKISYNEEKQKYIDAKSDYSMKCENAALKYCRDLMTYIDNAEIKLMRMEWQKSCD